MSFSRYRFSAEVPPTPSSVADYYYIIGDARPRRTALSAYHLGRRQASKYRYVHHGRYDKATMDIVEKVIMDLWNYGRTSLERRYAAREEDPKVLNVRML